MLSTSSQTLKNFERGFGTLAVACLALGNDKLMSRVS